MRLCRTPDGIGRLDGDELAYLDAPHPDVAAFFGDTSASAENMPVRSRVPVGDAVLLAPIISPATVVIVGFNYKAHIAETGAETPESPPLAAAAAGPGVSIAWNDDIVLPAEAPTKVDYEGEVGVVIGRVASNIDARHAWDVIGGLVVVNDVSARDVQRSDMERGDLSRGIGKLFPTFKPMGGWVTTGDEFRDGAIDLELETIVNGERRQHARTSDLLFGIPELIEAASSVTDLQPGDLICTGTPGGVGAPTGSFLAPGDVVEVRVDGLGAVENKVVSHG
ncbi:MAG: fumarylacetoacetate hydrolase family protein [Acidimicrobiales bacterium]